MPDCCASSSSLVLRSASGASCRCYVAACRTAALALLVHQTKNDESKQQDAQIMRYSAEREFFLILGSGESLASEKGPFSIFNVNKSNF